MSNTLLHLPCPAGQVSDGYHTFDELYAHRVALFLALASSLGTGWRSLFHADGSMFEGWFIAGMMLSTGAITYHLPIATWEAASFMHTLKYAPAWDGHTPADVVERLMIFAGLLDEEDIA